ncbi:MAG: cold shock domain-containing protein [Xanthomonadaceae bacterium]|nr:cold shock domain-containing protein [Xanthomonadaceae bacterium]MDP2184481.1 cold shock domain-containing protein [Xanthomonadales bacterium]
MKRGHVKPFGVGQGVIRPDDDSADVLFLQTVVRGMREQAVGAAVEYSLYQGDDEPEASVVVLL